jgi:hypothetical protein
LSSLRFDRFENKQNKKKQKQSFHTTVDWSRVRPLYKCEEILLSIQETEWLVIVATFDHPLVEAEKKKQLKRIKYIIGKKPFQHNSW